MFGFVTSFPMNIFGFAGKLWIFRTCSLTPRSCDQFTNSDPEGTINARMHGWLGQRAQKRNNVMRGVDKRAPKSFLDKIVTEEEWRAGFQLEIN